MDPTSNPGQSPANAPASHQPSTPPRQTRLSAHQVAEANEVRQHRIERRAHDRCWWSDRHPMPKSGEADRRNLFASTSNAPIGEEEATAIVELWKSIVTNPETGTLEPMGHHLRSSTPPMQRADKASERLAQQGVAVSDRMFKTIFEQATTNSGLDAAMQEYFRDKDEVPVRYVNEYRVRIDRLKMEMSLQLARKEAALSKLNGDFDEYKKRAERQERDFDEFRKEKEDLEDRAHEEIFKLQTKICDDEGKFAAQESENADLRNLIHHIQLRNNDLEKDNAEMQSELQANAQRRGKMAANDDMARAQQFPADDASPFESLDMINDELISAKAKLVAEQVENDALEAFYTAFYQDLQVARCSWSVFVKTVAEMPDAQQKLSTETRQLIRKMYLELEDLERKFLLRHPGIQESRRAGQLKRDALTKAALDKAQSSLRAELERVVTLKEALIGHEMEHARRLRRLDILTMGGPKLKKAEGGRVLDAFASCSSDEESLDENHGSSTSEEKSTQGSSRRVRHDWE
ncbi:hypothetical protein AK830_g11915 [Neonectria ditissima]|uniref:Uncharacterized protein n=1 Tax=Neonectria ditissima TaxID=78410 RepID=A0A0P7B4A7_9HYPO|nr:hypothetical protein AK830_g11915 [Neonectria ditissima]